MNKKKRKVNYELYNITRVSDVIISTCIFFLDDHSRVILTMQHDGASDYINANYIDVRFLERRAFNCMLLSFNFFTKSINRNIDIQLN